MLVGFVMGVLACMASADGEDAYRAAVEADWARQEERLGRTQADPAAVRAVFERGRRLTADLVTSGESPDVLGETSALDALARRVARLEKLSTKKRLSLYNEVRWIVRTAALRNPLVQNRPIVFMQRHRFICQMLHEYLGYYYDYGDIDGGGMYILERPGHSFATRDLTPQSLHRGNWTTLSLSNDAQTVYFAFAARTDGPKPDFYSPERQCFHIYAMDVDGGNLRQLTHGPDDDFDPCPLPDGGIAFMSTRRGGFTRCNNPWEPLPAHTLHRMDADGANVRTLSFHETSEWHPSVLRDGSIVYIRWDYVDRSAAHFHGLWLTSPDGTNSRALFGNYTQRINACYQPKAIPNSNKIVFLAGAHHANVGGSIVLLDPQRTRLDPETGQDSLGAIERLTPEVCFPEAPGWPASYFHSPWPLSENYYLVSFSFDPLPGMGPEVKEDTVTGLYLFDRFGNLELLYRDEDISSMYPIPLQARSSSPTIPSVLDPRLGDEGEFVLTDVAHNPFGFPAQRPVRELRVFQILPKSETHIANDPRIGYANAESARMLLGSVPVEIDGSAYFRAPARVPLVFQAVDGDGRAVQGMRSVAYLQPGERRSCVGCHEPGAATPSTSVPLAARRGASAIEPGPDGSRPWNYMRLVQPILERHCVRCHDGGDDAAAPGLSHHPKDEFVASYVGLEPYVRWYEWGEKSIRPLVTRPGEMASDVSPLTAVLKDATHAPQLALTDEELRRIYLWLDGNAAFYGSYSVSKRLAQRNGEAVPVPTLQ